MLKWFVLFAVCCFAAATGAMGSDHQDAVTARISSSEIVVANQSEKPVCYAIHEADVLTRIEWGPECSDKNQIPPRQAVRIPIAPGDFRPSGEAVISWWYKGKYVVEGQIRLKTGG